MTSVTSDTPCVFCTTRAEEFQKDPFVAELLLTLARSRSKASRAQLYEKIAVLHQRHTAVFQTRLKQLGLKLPVPPAWTYEQIRAHEQDHVLTRETWTDFKKWAAYRN